VKEFPGPVTEQAVHRAIEHILDKLEAEDYHAVEAIVLGRFGATADLIRALIENYGTPGELRPGPHRVKRLPGTGYNFKINLDSNATSARVGPIGGAEVTLPLDGEDESDLTAIFTIYASEHGFIIDLDNIEMM
jgi:hypothetical protein